MVVLQASGKPCFLAASGITLVLGVQCPDVTCVWQQLTEILSSAQDILDLYLGGFCEHL